MMTRALARAVTAAYSAGSPLTTGYAEPVTAYVGPAAGYAGTGSAMSGGVDVRVSFLDHAGPRPGAVLWSLATAGHRSAVVVPLLLTAAYHGRVDLPAVLAEARANGLHLAVAVTDVLGPVEGVVPELLLGGLRRRLGETHGGARGRTGYDRSVYDGCAHYDGLVLAAAGTRDELARQSVTLAAKRLGADLGVPCEVGYASASAPTGGQAVRTLRAAGARRGGVAAYFLACGRLYDTVVGSALAAGATAAALPLGAAPELAELVLARVRAVEPLPVG